MMKIFISHSSKDKRLANTLSNFLESLDPSVEVFCSSQIGSIKVGMDFVNTITKELDLCDAFIPLLSNNYYDSRFCMIELGFAYAVLVQKHAEDQRYIFPLVVPPVQKSEALAGTPLVQMQVASICDVDDIRICLESIFAQLNAGINKKIHAFVKDVKTCLFDRNDIIKKARFMACKSGNVQGEDEDYIQYDMLPDQNGVAVKFTAKPFDRNAVYPDFLSFVYKYVDKIDLNNATVLFEKAALEFHINNLTNSIRKIDIEFKCFDSMACLHKQTISLESGINNITIPLEELKSEALKQVSEICFVLKPSAYIQDEGVFQICDFELVLQ